MNPDRCRTLPSRNLPVHRLPVEIIGHHTCIVVGRHLMNECMILCHIVVVQIDHCLVVFFSTGSGRSAANGSEGKFEGRERERERGQQVPFYSGDVLAYAAHGHIIIMFK